MRGVVVIVVAAVGPGRGGRAAGPYSAMCRTPKQRQRPQTAETTPSGVKYEVPVVAVPAFGMSTK